VRSLSIVIRTCPMELLSFLILQKEVSVIDMLGHESKNVYHLFCPVRQQSL
jgi:hypothetical protein